MHNLKIKPGIGCYCPFSTCAYLSSYAHLVRTDSVRPYVCCWKCKHIDLAKEASSEELTLDVQTKVHSFNSKQNDSTK